MAIGLAASRRFWLRVLPPIRGAGDFLAGSLSLSVALDLFLVLECIGRSLRLVQEHDHCSRLATSAV